MTRKRHISDRGLESAIIETKRAIYDIAQTLDLMDSKIDYMIESWRHYVPIEDERTASESYE